jgi:hypothetical protein
MQVSAEVRWFWHKTPPEGLKDWFCNANNDHCAAGGGVEEREDKYLRDASQSELGLKLRGNKKGVEVKGLVVVIWGGLTVQPFAGPVELWTKWTSEPLELNSNSTISVAKLRWLRKFDTTAQLPQEIPLDDKEQPRKDRPLPALGCNVELTQVRLQNEDVWWTYGFEAFGTIRTVTNDLRAVATMLAARQPPDLKEGLLASYPAWLEERV